MAINKTKLVFDVTDVDTIAASDSVGAFLRASDGTLLTHSDVGGKKALDVSIADGVNVEVDLSHVDDSVRLGDGTDFFTSTSENGDVALDVHISNTSIAVTATDLDVRDLTHVSDSVKVGDGTDFLAVNADGSINSVVTATDLDIRDLLFSQDSVTSYTADASGNLITSTDLGGGVRGLDVNVGNTIAVNDAALADTAIAAKVKTLATGGTAEDIITSPLANRKYLFVMNNSNKMVYVGGTGVTASNLYHQVLLLN